MRLKNGLIHDGKHVFHEVREKSVKEPIFYPNHQSGKQKGLYNFSCEEQRRKLPVSDVRTAPGTAVQ